MPGWRSPTSGRARQDEAGGFIALLVGVESTQDATLKSMGKGFTIAQVRERFQVLRKSGMVINAYFIVGNLAESKSRCSPRHHSPARSAST